jgi:hypothetical protein
MFDGDPSEATTSLKWITVIHLHSSYILERDQNNMNFQMIWL